MCFSASASFGAGIVLSVIGTASVVKVQNRSQMAFAAIPLIFAIQQFSEGFLWLSLQHPGYAFLQQSTTYLFLFFAQVVWPVWVPFSVLKLEPPEAHKSIQKIMVGIGALVSVYLGYCLMTFHVEAKVVGHHIVYEQLYPETLRYFGGGLYLVATIAPPFFSRLKHMFLIGWAILVSYIVSTIFYEGYVISVWCFFASVISLAVFAVMREVKNRHDAITAHRIPSGS
jgi:hypothetical protein